jgi:hypothetical protein
MLGQARHVRAFFPPKAFDAILSTFLVDG